MELKAVIKKEVRVYPKDNDLQVEFYTDVPIGVVEVLQDETLSEFNRVVMFLKSIISDWNFADSNNTKLNIDETSIKSLGSDLVNWLVNEGISLIQPDDTKKKE